jgi:hypothetical protein
VRAWPVRLRSPSWRFSAFCRVRRTQLPWAKLDLALDLHDLVIGDGTSKVDVSATTFCARCLLLDTDAHHGRRREAPSRWQTRARACAVQVQVKTTPRGLLSRVLRICTAGHGEQWCPDWRQTDAEVDPRRRRALRSTRRRAMLLLGGGGLGTLSTPRTQSETATRYFLLRPRKACITAVDTREREAFSPRSYVSKLM